jgi:hypothetical protein
MTIQNVNDLVVNHVYFITLSKKQKAFKSKYLGCVKTKHEPDFYFKHLERKGFKDSISYFGINEIGIGNTKEDTQLNYGKLKVELPEIHFENYESLKEKIPV